MRTILATILALLLIIFGVVIVGLVGVRIWQESGFLRMDIDTGATSLSNDLLSMQTAQPLLSGVESGSMALGTAEAPAEMAFAAGGAPADVAPELTLLPTFFPTLFPTLLPTLDPCPPQPEGGFAAETSVVAVGMVRLYSETDVLSPTLGEFSAGQSFVVTADPAGATAVRRCELVWVRVRLIGGAQGWVLASAVEIAPPTAVPTMPPICPGGCATPTCAVPCYDPCQQPCTDPCNLPCTQPCTTPCGVYSQ